MYRCIKRHPCVCIRVYNNFKKYDFFCQSTKSPEMPSPSFFFFFFLSTLSCMKPPARQNPRGKFLLHCPNIPNTPPMSTRTYTHACRHVRCAEKTIGRRACKTLNLAGPFCFLCFVFQNSALRIRFTCYFEKQFQV